MPRVNTPAVPQGNVSLTTWLRYLDGRVLKCEYEISQEKGRISSARNAAQTMNSLGPFVGVIGGLFANIPATNAETRLSELEDELRRWQEGKQRVQSYANGKGLDWSCDENHANMVWEGYIN